MTLDIKRGCHHSDVNLTLPDHVDIPPQLITDLMLISHGGDRSRQEIPKFNSQLRAYHIPYCIAEYKITTRHRHRVIRKAQKLSE